MVLVLHIDQSQFLSLVLSDKVNQFATLFNLIETLNELIGKSVNPFNKLVFDVDQSLANIFLPFSNNGYRWLIFKDSLARIFFDGFELFQLLFVPLVNIMKILLGNDTLQAFVTLFNFRVERGWSIVSLTIYTEC